MKKVLKFLGSFGAAWLAVPVMAQGWNGVCIDPANTQPFSDDYRITGIGNALMFVTMGVSGTVTHGGQTGPCFGPTARTLNAAGRFAFGSPEGSVQTSFDDELAFTMGWPGEPVGDYTFARVITAVDPQTGRFTSELFGEGGLAATFVGASDRYFIASWNGTNISARLEVKVLGDAARMQWDITNPSFTESRLGGLFWAVMPAMIGQQPDHLGFSTAGSTLPNPFVSKNVDEYMNFTVFPGRVPIRTETKRDANDPDFPNWVKSMWGQTEAYGIRMDNRTPAETPDATPTDLVKVGGWGSTSANNTVEDRVIFDGTGAVDDTDVFLSSIGGPGGNAASIVLQRFAPEALAPRQTRRIIHYIRSTWSTGNYTDPYTVVLDAPRAVHFQDPAQGQDPNPMTVRLWIDNQYATLDLSVALVNVRAKIFLPPGLSLAPGETLEKTLGRVAPNAVVPIDWQVVSDGRTFGDLPVRVEVSPVPGPTKSLTQMIRVAAVPRIDLQAAPNMVSLPYSFGDSSLESILGLTAGIDFVAYGWDPTLRSYQPVQGIQRGLGYWIVPQTSHAALELNQAAAPADQATGGLLVNLQPGWNLIGNPYNYAVPLRTLFGVSETRPETSQSWDELVRNELVASSLTTFEPNVALPGGGSYVLTTEDANIEPHRAYWLFVSSNRPLRLVWPPNFQETLPNAGRSLGPRWAQSEREWRLQLSARSTLGHDTNNFVGVVADRDRARTLDVPKAPMAPGAKMELSVVESRNGEPTRMAQSVADRPGRQEWTVQVRADEAGEVTVTWPNLPSLPRGLRARLTDPVTGERVDLRASSGYTVRMSEPGIRSLTLTVEPGGSSRPVIGNVVVTPSGRSGDSPVTISYSLSSEALVTVRILSASGREVFTAARGRSSDAGENQVTWALRDNANRAVAPGTYRVEILAETPNGERVRRIVPVNVVR